MRFAPVLALSLVGLVAACAGASEDTDASGAAESSKQDDSVAYGPCGFTRAELLKQVSAARGDAITRGFEWYDDKIPFNKAATHDKYRTDCSGFVSMCWQLGAPGQTTSTLGKSSGASKLSSYDDLVPADALVWAGHHSMIFLGWNDSAKKGACVLEEASTASDMQFRVRLTASLKGSGFVPVRSDDFADDTDYTPAKHAGSGNSSTSTGSTTPVVDAGSSTGTGTSTGTGSSSGSSGSNGSTGGTYTCTPYTAAAACKDAYDNRGVECGKVSDGCGGTVDCITVYPAGCGTNSDVVCSANKCVDTVCHPKTGAAACLAAGSECGTAPDGCGGTVNCDDVAGYGCATNETCASNNKCYAPNAVPADAGTSTSTTTGATTTTHTNGTLGVAADEDNGDNAPSSPSTSASSSTPARSLSSAGCNAAPGTGMDLAPLAGLALVLAGLRRRAKGTKKAA